MKGEMFIVANKDKQVVKFLWGKYHQNLKASEQAWKSGCQKQSYILRVKAKDAYEDLKKLDPRPVFLEAGEGFIKFNTFDEIKEFLNENRSEITYDGNNKRYRVWFSDDMGVTNFSFYDVFSVRHEE